MSIPASEVIYELLLNLGLLKATGKWQGFIGFLPDSPDEAIVIYDTSGKLDGRMMRTGETIVHPGINVQVRGRNYPEARNKIQEIAVALEQQIRTSIAVESDSLYIIHAISRSGDILPVGVENVGDRRRHYFSLNVTTTTEKVN